MENEINNYWPAGETPEKDRSKIQSRGNTWKSANDITKILPNGQVIVKHGDGWYYAEKNENPNGQDVGDYFTQTGVNGFINTSNYPEYIKPVLATNAGINYKDSTNNFQWNNRGYYLINLNKPYSENIETGTEYRTFNDAYKNAVNSGKSVFDFNGKSYNTKNNPNMASDLINLGNSRTEMRDWKSINNGEKTYTPWQTINQTSYKIGGIINYLNLF